MTKFPRKLFSSVLALIVTFAALNLSIYAENQAALKHYIDAPVVNAGNNTGYSESNKIEESDPHFGWSIGEFYVSGYTAGTLNENGDPVFLKNVGDKVTLEFKLNQDIDALNGNESLSVNGDTDGYDEYFGVSKTDFGRGTLIVRHKDYENYWGEPQIYTDFLSGAASDSANIWIETYEEGDYEVALNYELKDVTLSVLGLELFPSCPNYRVFFRFSVRNGNCMVYPFDVETGDELTNTAITENGFYLDLAKSRYLDINIKKSTLNEGADGLTEDVLFNRPAKDGDEYTEEGIYTITVSNKYTKQETVKTVYVGNDSVLKAYVATGLSISEINRQVALGATINDDGTINYPSDETAPPETTAEETAATAEKTTAEETAAVENKENGSSNFVFIIIIIVVVIVAAIIILMLIFKAKKEKNSPPPTDNTDSDLNKSSEITSESDEEKENGKGGDEG